MDLPQIYILISIVILAILFFFLNKNKQNKRFTLLASIACIFVVMGIIFSDNKLIGYGLIGIGIILAFIDIIKKSKK